MNTWTDAFEEDEQLVEMCVPFFVSLEELVVFPGYTDVIALPIVRCIWLLCISLTFCYCIRTLKLCIYDLGMDIIAV